MGFDLEALRRAVAEHGRVARVIVAEAKGSSPREVGAAMMVWQSGQSGTIGGGTLEYQAAEAARAQKTARRLTRHALGPDLGQCCGGAVALLTEIYDAERVSALEGDVIARPARTDAPTDMPLTVKRIMSAARNQGVLPGSQLVAGWMVEARHRPHQPLWIWGAGHVGRALIDVMAPLPDYDITWVDAGPARFPEAAPQSVAVLPAENMVRLVPHAPGNAQHMVLTYSHELDLALCHALLNHAFSFAGVIGSATKWARFRSRLAELGHRPEHIARISCPIGRKELGKHPQAIALGVASELLALGAEQEQKKEARA